MLQNTGFLAGASPALMSALESLADRVDLKKGETLFSQGDTGDSFYSILNGELELSVLSADGRKLSLALMRDGECLGEISLFDPEVRTATAIALSDTSLYRVASKDLMRKVAETPELSVDLLMLAGRRMRWMSGQISEQALLPLSARLARRVLYLCANVPEGEVLKMSHAALADYVGATREAVSRLVSDWKKQGVIDASRSGVIILDKEALEDIADFPFL